MAKIHQITFPHLIMYLNDKIESHFRIDLIQKKALTRLGIVTICDLLYYFPSRYTDISEFRHINTLTDGEQATVIGVISDLKTKKSFHSKIPIGEATLTDLTGKINIILVPSTISSKNVEGGLD